jgi:hypothetical protein
MAIVTVSKLRCVSCGNEFPISSTRKPTHIECPFCQSRVPDDLVEPIYQAILSVSGVNSEFRSRTLERNESEFVLSVTDEEVHLESDDIE